MGQPAPLAHFGLFVWQSNHGARGTESNVWTAGEGILY